MSVMTRCILCGKDIDKEYYMCPKCTEGRCSLQEAKDLSLEIWRYFRDNPDITRKLDLPAELFNKINKFPFACPLCEIFRANVYESMRYNGCPGCPLKSCERKSDFDNWVRAKNARTRKKYAAKIVCKIEAWKVEV